MPKGKGPPRKPTTWRRMDLHIHTPASADFKEKGVTYLQFLQQAEAKGLDIMAITDHNTVAGYAAMYEEVEMLLHLEQSGRLTSEEAHTLAEYRRLSDKIMLLPGFEITTTLGFHVLGIFPPGTKVRRLEHILLELNIPEDKMELGSMEVGAASDVLTVYRTINEAGGLVIAAHVNSAHGVALQGFDFGGQTKIAYTQDKYLHALEVTDLESTSRRRTANFFNGSKPEYPRRMHCIQGSDSHYLVHNPADRSNPNGLGDRVTEVLLPEVSFEALLEIFQGDDFTRTRPYRPAAQAPFDYIKEARKQGPNIVQCFHETFSPKPGRLAAIINDVAAFANTNGGTVYVGVAANPKTPVKGVDKPEEAVEIIRQEIQKAITPPVDVTVEVRTSEGKKVLEVKVPKGTETPYVLSTGPIYVRQESETGLAMRDEIIRLVEGARRPAVAPPVEKVAPPAVPVEAAIAPAPAPVEIAPALQPALPVEAPKTGVEVVDAEEREGIWYYTVRDLRNGNIVHNVTRFSARHLWKYALTEREEHPIRESDVTWQGDLGLWKTYKRAGVKRYNLVQRDSDGGLHVYYGVTEDGVFGPWRAFVEGEAAEPAP
jgi:hypothetical protein